MRGFAILYLAACGNAAAVGLPESSNAERPSLWDTQSPLHHGIDRAINHHEVDLASIARIVEDVRESISKQISSVADRADALADTAHEFLGSDRPEIQGHGQPNQTIYQYIKSSDHTTKFADLIDQHENLVKLLNSTDSQNYTLFVPLDEAFDGIPDDPNNKPSKEAVEALLKYHIGVGEYPASRILTTGTIPTVLEETWLGGDPQRLRTSVGLAGVRVNFYSKVLAANIVS